MRNFIGGERKADRRQPIAKGCSPLQVLSSAYDRGNSLRTKGRSKKNLMPSTKKRDVVAFFNAVGHGYPPRMATVTDCPVSKPTVLGSA